MVYPPQYVKHIIKTLQSHEYSAYLVGGCVRDMLLNIVPQDWDICTSAHPDELLSLFPNSRPTGIKHGTVTIISGSHEVEVTTFRSDGDYLDHRRPDHVSFVSDLTTDLSRRDFTINAMAISSDGELTDPFNGRNDLSEQMIRCVGDPNKRFEEDALRMFRAVRFSARYNFAIEENTVIAIKNCAASAEYLAAERVREEISKILLSNNTDRIGWLLEWGLLSNYCNGGLLIPDFSKISKSKKKSFIRWSTLCYYLKESGWISTYSQFLHRLKLDNRTIKTCSNCSIILDSDSNYDLVSWKHHLSRFGLDSAECAATILDLVQGTNHRKELASILKSGECFTVKYLAVNGTDLIDLGYSGPVLGEMMQFLLDYVIEHPDMNKRNILIQLAEDHEEI